MFREGVRLSDDYRTLPARTRRVEGKPDRFILTITEGKNRQIRRMCSMAGYAVRSLHRYAIGAFKLNSVPEGEWRLMTDQERLLSLKNIGTTRISLPEEGVDQ